MELSIIIVNYNTKNLTLSCINSIKSADFTGKYEIIVVDNHSEDGSLEALEKLKSIKLIKNSDNLGFAKANNIGIKKALGKYILLLNSDTKVKKGSLDRLVSFAKSHDKAGVVGAKLLNKDGSVQPSAFHFPSITNAIGYYLLGRDTSPLKYFPQGKDAVEVDAVVGASFLITPEAKRKVGLLSEKYFMYFEDIDYCRKVREVGLKVYYLPDAEVIHYHGASGKGGENERLIDASKKYHGTFGYYIYSLTLRVGQKWQKFLKSV